MTTPSGKSVTRLIDGFGAVGEHAAMTCAARHSPTIRIDLFMEPSLLQCGFQQSSYFRKRDANPAY